MIVVLVWMNNGLMNVGVLNGLFKPYEKTTGNDCDNELLDYKVIMEIMMDEECSKSKNETCVNVDCTYNMIDMHEDEVYLDLSNVGGDVNE